MINIPEPRGGKIMAKSLERIKEVNIDVIENGEVTQETITVKKAPLGNWKRLTDSMQKLLNLLPGVLEEKGLEEKEELEQYFENMTQQDVLMLLPDMMEVAFEEVIKILALGTDKDAEYMKEKVGLDEAVGILEAIIEVNNLTKVVEKGKNMMNLLNGVTGRS